jgi:hypothetical protein
VYSRAEVVLLDDVLAALDVHTAKHVVERCFRGPLLRGRTVLLVTHNVAMTAPVADYVISLGVDGRVRSRGTVKEALARDSVFKRELAQEEKELKKAEDVDSEDESAATAAEAVPAQTGDGKLIMKEEIAEGHVSWAASASAPGPLRPCRVLTVACSAHVLLEYGRRLDRAVLAAHPRRHAHVRGPELGPDVVPRLLGRSVRALPGRPGQRGLVRAQLLRPAWPLTPRSYLTVYTVLLGVAVVAYCIWFALFTFGQVRASRSIHQTLIDSTLGSTLRWLDTTPTSR